MRHTRPIGARAHSPMQPSPVPEPDSAPLMLARPQSGDAIAEQISYVFHPLGFLGPPSISVSTVIRVAGLTPTHGSSGE